MAAPARPARPRAVTDYTLARRSTLADLFSGRASAMDVCDAHPYLLRAAKFHGEPAADPCPVCRLDQLTHVTYTYGDCFRGDTNGRVRRTGELPELAATLPEFTVYVVEVCQRCGWNHLRTSYVLGAATEGARDAGRSRRTLARE